jgi:hypothetical protein
MKKQTNSEKTIENNIRKQLEETSETLSRQRASSPDMPYLSPAVQAYTSYLNYKSQERSLKQIRITAYATVVLAFATLVLALITAFHP